jgi:hypothetical protein
VFSRIAAIGENLLGLIRSYQCGNLIACSSAAQHRRAFCEAPRFGRGLRHHDRPGIKVLDAHGKPAQFKFSPQDAAKWLRNFSTKVKLVDLTLDESLDAMDETQKKGIQGARIHDFLHAAAADKARSDELFTRNTNDFASLGHATLVWP